MTEPVDTEKGFFLTSNVHKIHFRPGLCPGPDPVGGAYDGYNAYKSAGLM